MRAQRSTLPPRRTQQGAVAIMAAVMLTTLLGFAGLALDSGRLYVNRSEAQNGADACALAAAQELAPGAPLTPQDFLRARTSGTAVAGRNRRDFQNRSLESVTVEYAVTRNGPVWVRNGTLPTAYFVRCTVTTLPVRTWLMGMRGNTRNTVTAVAVATRSLAGGGPPNCANGPSSCTARPSLVQ